MITRSPHPGSFHDESSGDSMLKFETVAEIMVRTTLALLNEDERERLIAAAHKKPYAVPRDLLRACEEMADKDNVMNNIVKNFGRK